jgi:hypothetical protein
MMNRTEKTRIVIKISAKRYSTRKYDTNHLTALEKEENKKKLIISTKPDHF